MKKRDKMFSISTKKTSQEGRIDLYLLNLTGSFYTKKLYGYKPEQTKARKCIDVTDATVV